MLDEKTLKKYLATEEIESLNAKHKAEADMLTAAMGKVVEACKRDTDALRAANRALADQVARDRHDLPAIELKGRLIGAREVAR